MNVTVGFSTTKCKLKIIDICTLNLLHVCSQPHNKNKYTEIRNESFDFPNPKYSNEGHGQWLNVNIQDRDCLVFHFVDETEDYMYKMKIDLSHRCMVNVLIQLVVDLNETKFIEVFSTGYLSGISYINSS